ncbi:MAG: ABC transporter ATP-binding protein [Methanomicrobiaceae archaeon]|nr:ABC transporter ATP-binding protein [Methanomicrobiaceae archaeon]
MTKPLVEVKDVSLTLNGHKVLDHVSIDIYPGEFHAIIGPNGGGKTTLLKVILGLITPDSGMVKIDGRSPEENRSVLGYVPQFRTYDFSYPISVREMVLSGRLGHIKGLRKRFRPEDGKAADEAMETMDISAFSDHHIDELSGGEQQRVMIARAIAGDPKVLLLDEPTVYIDSPTAEKFFELLFSLRERMAIVMVTHDIGSLTPEVDKVACLNHRIYTHHDSEVTDDMLLAAYGCPIDVIGHGVPHRVFRRHE